MTDVSANICVDCQSIYRPLCWPILARLSANMLVAGDQFASDIRSLQSIGRYFAEGSSAYHQHLANVTADTLVEMLVDMSVDASVEWQSSIGCISVKTWLVLDRYSLSVDS